MDRDPVRPPRATGTNRRARHRTAVVVPADAEDARPRGGRRVGMRFPAPRRPPAPGPPRPPAAGRSTGTVLETTLVLLKICKINLGT